MQQVTAHRIKYILADFCSASAGFFLFNIFRFHTMPGEITGYDLWRFMTKEYLIAEQCLVPILVVVLYSLSGSYNKTNTLYKSRLEETLTTLIVSLLAMLVVFFVALINDSIQERATNYELMLALFAALFVPTFIVRMLILNANAKKIRRGEYFIDTVVVGASPSYKPRLEKIMKSSIYNGFRIIAVVDTDKSYPGDEILGLPVYHSDDPAGICKRPFVVDAAEMEHAVRYDPHQLPPVWLAEFLGVGSHGDEREVYVTGYLVIMAIVEGDDIGEIVMTEIFAVGVEYVGVAAEEVVDVAYPFAVGRGDDTEPSSCLFKVDVGHLDVGGLEIYHCIWS